MPEIEQRIRSARVLVSSRLSLVESCRALIRQRARGVAHGRVLRALDAIHLATFVLARREIEGLQLLTADQRLHAAATERRDAGA